MKTNFQIVRDVVNHIFDITNLDELQHFEQQIALVSKKIEERKDILVEKTKISQPRNFPYRESLRDSSAGGFKGTTWTGALPS